MADLLDLIRPTPESIQQMIMQQRLQQQQSAPVDLTQDNGENADYLTQLQNSSLYSPPQRVRATLPAQSVPASMPASDSAYEPTSGSKMEADSRNSIDDLMAQLAGQRDQYHQQDRNQQWMSFFSKLASSKAPTLLGGLGEGATALSDVAAKQSANNQLLDQSALQDQVKYREWEKQQELEQQKADQTAKYQQGELANKSAALEQGKYTITPDGLGGFIKINNKTGDTEAVNSPATPTMTTGVDDKGNPLAGDDYLKSLDPRIARTAKMVANGDMPWPSGFALKSPYWQNVIAAAQTYDPTANGNRFPAVAKFNTGKQGDQVRSFDVGLTHLDTLENLTDALGNGDIKAINSAANTWETQTGQPAPANFNAAKEVVGNEIVKAIVGAGGGVGDREKAQKALDAAGSQKQLKGVIGTYKTLMKGQIQGLKQQYENATGRKDFMSRLSPNSQKYFNDDSASSSTSTAATNSTPDYSHLWGQ